MEGIGEACLSSWGTNFDLVLKGSSTLFLLAINTIVKHQGDAWAMKIKEKGGIKRLA